MKKLKKQPDATILLNGETPIAIQNQYIQLATKNNIRFTVVNDFVSDAPDSIGLLLAAKQAVNEPVIDIEEKYPKEEQAEPEEKKNKKKSLLGSLVLIQISIFPTETTAKSQES